MANILFVLNGTDGTPTKLSETSEVINIGTLAKCWIYGRKGTFCIFRDGEDAIASIGYVAHLESDSLQESLIKIFSSFQESKIGELKKKLIGQYVLVIKKGQEIYIFADILGARNIFYSENGKIISSSFSEVEELLQTKSSDLDLYKVLEYLAVRHVLYPTWLGRSTDHKRIRWLLPYEYLVINVERGIFRLGSIVYSIDNRKQSDRYLLASELSSSLRAIVRRSEFKDSPVAASLSGGRDSRVVAAIAAEYYRKVRFRIAVAPGHFDSMKDMEVAKKLARVQGVPLDVYQFQPGRDEERFRELTEGFSPSFNNKIAAVIDNVGAYSLGLGGVFGTELFMPIPWSSIDNFIQARVDLAKQALKVGDDFWKSFRESLYDEFQRTKHHFQLSNSDDRDYIRLFIMLDTARYASFILSAFNRLGYQLEPYGSYSVLELALRVAPALWGNHRRFGGDALVQQASMSKLNLRMARILTYKNYRPMLPLSVTLLPLYMMGFSCQAGDWMRRKFDKKLKESTRTELPDGYYLSDGWEDQFIGRTVKKYGLSVKSSVLS